MAEKIAVAVLIVAMALPVGIAIHRALKTASAKLTEIFDDELDITVAD